EVRDRILGSARVSRVGDGVSPARTFHSASASMKTLRKIVSARHRNQRARRARSPDLAQAVKDIGHHISEVLPVDRALRRAMLKFAPKAFGAISCHRARSARSTFHGWTLS